VLKPAVWSAVRIGLAALTLTAVARQLTLQLQLGLSPVNFFSFFTILSNLLASVVLLSEAAAVLRGRPLGPSAETIRGASVAMMALVGVGFSLLLRDTDLGPLLPWVNTVTHYLMPVAVVLDWLLVPPRHPVPLARIGAWAVFPLLYLVYALIRGSLVGWYPYPFLDPGKVGGYGGVALYCLALLAAFLVTSWLLVLAGNRGARQGG
jgi:hypothetical protein